LGRSGPFFEFWRHARSRGNLGRAYKLLIRNNNSFYKWLEVTRFFSPALWLIVAFCGYRFTGSLLVC
jgi:hypothetical protein